MKKKSFKKKYELGVQFADVRPGGTEADYQRIQAAEAAKYAGKGQKTGSLIGGLVGGIGGAVGTALTLNPAFLTAGLSLGTKYGGMIGHDLGVKKGNKIGGQKGQEYVQNLNANRNQDIQDNAVIANQLMQYSGDEAYQNSNLMGYNSSPLGGAVLTGGRGNLLSGGVQPGQYSINYGKGSTDFGLAGSIKPYKALDYISNGLIDAANIYSMSISGGGNKGQQNSAAGVANQLMQATAAKGAQSTNKALVEVEKDELVFRRDPKNPNKIRLVADFVGGKPHSQGGEDFVAQEGDIIFPGKKRQNIKQLLDQNGYVRDINTFAKEVQKLPEDTQEKPMTEEVMMKKGVRSFKKPMYGPGTKRVNAIGEVIDDGVEPLSVNNSALLNANQALNFKIANNITPSVYKGLSGDSFDYNENNPYVDFNQKELNTIVNNTNRFKKIEPNIPNATISNYDKQPSKFGTFLKGVPGALGNFWNNTADERQKAGKFLKDNQGTFMNLANQLIPEIDPKGKLADQTAEAYARSLMAEKPEIRQPTQVSFSTQRYQDRSAPLRNQLLLNQKMLQANSRNASAGSGNVLLSNLYQQNAGLQNQMSQIENQEALRADQIDASNTNINNQQAQVNAQFYDQNVTANEQNRAVARNLNRQGFGTLSGLYNSQAMNNYMVQRDRAMMQENQRANNMKAALQQDALLFSMASNPQAVMSLGPYLKQKYPELYGQFEQMYGTEADQKIAEEFRNKIKFDPSFIEQYSENDLASFSNDLEQKAQGTRSFKVKKSYGDGTKEVKVRQNDGSIKTYLTDTPEYKEIYDKGGLGIYNKDDDSWSIGKPLEEVKIFDKKPLWLTDKENLESKYSKDWYIANKMPKMARSLGLNSENFQGENLENYNRFINEELAKEILKRNPNFDTEVDSDRLSALNKLSKPEQEIIRNSSLGYKLEPTALDKGMQGLVSVLKNPMAGNYVHPSLTEEEAYQNSGLSGLISPMDIPGKVVQSMYKDNYSLNNALKGKANNASTLEDLGTSLIGDASIGVLGAVGAKGLNYLGKGLSYTEEAAKPIKEFASNKIKSFKNKAGELADKASPYIKTVTDKGKEVGTKIREDVIAPVNKGFISFLAEDGDIFTKNKKKPLTDADLRMLDHKLANEKADIQKRYDDQVLYKRRKTNLDFVLDNANNVKSEEEFISSIGSNSGYTKEELLELKNAIDTNKSYEKTNNPLLLEWYDRKYRKESEEWKLSREKQKQLQKQKEEENYIKTEEVIKQRKEAFEKFKRENIKPLIPPKSFKK